MKRKLRRTPEVLFVCLVLAFAWVTMFEPITNPLGTSDAEAAKKKVLFPYKMVGVTAKWGGTVDSVIDITDNDISDLMKKADQGTYIWDYMPGHGDSSTYGIDSLGGASNSDGLFYDTLDFFFDVTDYDAGWLGYGIANYDSIHGDTDSSYIQIEAALGTSLGNSGVFYPIRLIGIQERGIGTGTLDTITFSEVHDDSLFPIPLDYDIPGGIDADSTLFLDKLRLRYILCDSALVGDQENDYSIEFRAWMLVKEEF